MHCNCCCYIHQMASHGAARRCTWWVQIPPSSTFLSGPEPNGPSFDSEAARLRDCALSVEHSASICPLQRQQLRCIACRPTCLRSPSVPQTSSAIRRKHPVGRSGDRTTQTSAGRVHGQVARAATNPHLLLRRTILRVGRLHPFCATSLRRKQSRAPSRHLPPFQPPSPPLPSRLLSLPRSLALAPVLYLYLPNHFRLEWRNRRPLPPTRRPLSPISRAC